ncbi:protein ENHANCER OF LHP1 1 isoform X1 [Prosopis cineraria]|uniref:protein ENHANCER OF LHP1 1 isoform X1 n=1 Tax=Prosopis cineraria TaxID=364024 RepID=UPI00240FC71C|nr:protein ENHANCER OF LHP1 1 isoform X1 [Prosopis cineraria]
MKIRSVKLREAHQAASNGRPSSCSVLWDQQAQHLVTACSSDVSISIHDPLLLSSAPKVLTHHRDGVTALALSPNSTCLASGSVDHSVKLYKFPGGEFQTNITRFTLPIRSLAFNKSGSLLAAAGDDEGIKLINTVDGSIARVVKGHKGTVTGLAFDPNGEYLASVDSSGTVIYWELHSGRIVHNLKGIAPDTRADVSAMNVLCWSPDGETLAVPGLKNDVVMYDRDTAEKLFTLKGDHTQPICFLSWSPNGKYMATSSSDRQILIWDVNRKQDIDRQKFNERICCMAWKPIGNAIAIIDVMGKFGIWDSVIPSSMKSPTEDIPTQSKNSNGLLLFDEEDPDLCESGSVSDLGEDSDGESELPSRKRLREQPSSKENFDEDGSDEIALHPKVESRKKPNHTHKEDLNTANVGLKSSIITCKPKMQEAFQPGSTPAQLGKRRFLCYTMLGSITTIEHDGYFHIEIDFHDTGSSPRVPSMMDHFGFTMAALNENGSVFANPCKGEKNMSTLMYRPFSSWASNSEWSMRFEGEEVKVVALGTAWVAAATSFNYLRIFTDGGLQRNIISLDGPVVTASGFKDKLAVVTHASDCFSLNNQVLEFRVFNIPDETQLLKGRLPLTPGSSLTWFGFSEEGQLSSYDSKGVLRVFTSQYGGSWLPLFSANKEKDENYWVVGLNAIKLFCVICKKPDVFPQVMPKPVLTLLNLSFPLASSDLGSEALENEFIMNNMHLFEIQKRMDEMAVAGLDAGSLDDEAFNLEAAQDRCILRLIASCCNGDKLVRATELVKLLSLEKSMKGAIKLVTALKLPNLAERFSSILEQRLLHEMKKPADSNHHQDDRTAPLTVDVSNSRSKVLAQTEAAATVSNSSSPKLSAPLLTKKAKSPGEAKAGIDKPVVANETVKGKNAGNDTNDREGKAGEIRRVSAHHSQDISVKSSNKQEVDKLDAGMAQPSRPSNPFLKSSIK